jgi:hypothetical protein
VHSVRLYVKQGEILTDATLPRAPENPNGNHRPQSDLHSSTLSDVRKANKTRETAGHSMLPPMDLPNNSHSQGSDAGSSQRTENSSFSSFVESTKRLLDRAEAAEPDLANGAHDRITQHRSDVYTEVAIGIGIGVVGVTVAAALPELAICGAVVGGIVAAKKLRDESRTFIHAADTVANASQHSATEVDAAHRALQREGVGAVDTAAIGVGALAGGSYAALSVAEATTAGELATGATH